MVVPFDPPVSQRACDGGGDGGLLGFIKVSLSSSGLDNLMNKKKIIMAAATEIGAAPFRGSFYVSSQDTQYQTLIRIRLQIIGGLCFRFLYHPPIHPTGAQTTRSIKKDYDCPNIG